MSAIEQLPFQGSLPASFFTIADRVYADAAFRPQEKPAAVEQLFRAEAARNDLVLYTDHRHLRLVGIFPHDGSDAHFGYWETTDDLPLNEAAFGLLRAEARRRGRVRLMGPLNFNTFYAYRLRLGAPPSWGQFDQEPANPAYYPTLLQRLGLAPGLTFESRLIRADAVPAAYLNKADLLGALQQIPFDFIPLNPDTWRTHETELFALVDRIFSANPAYRSISRAQFEQLYNPSFAAKLCPHTSVLFRDRAAGQLVALSFCQPNYAPLRLDPTPPDFERDYPRLPHKTMLAKTVGVHPDFRQQQLMSYLGAYGMLRFRELYDDAIFCLMRADNFSRHFTDGLPAETAHYALFEQVL
ncbi:hypothetical protein [Hymenobacter rubripertinctus]|uniref:GNAT family N-acetyltransferase n=1 Tax=Hymenobacter rubripertinctus TaxID=2029981 RepID=A0A418QXE4_9BACT|nr:hypothetical protein [Hymenobacter rubripertinctus]RIY09824.1 hypothetical protein D0T11_11690 [Hymenobacter rubripertinctus]